MHDAEGKFTSLLKSNSSNDRSAGRSANVTRDNSANIVESDNTREWRPVGMLSDVIDLTAPTSSDIEEKPKKRIFYTMISQKSKRYAKVHSSSSKICESSET